MRPAVGRLPVETTRMAPPACPWDRKDQGYLRDSGVLPGRVGELELPSAV